ncbi:hypothetical protein AG1IA_01578 [Rhizoctonia solani AG-1 IA]|uniref:Uncharacterized protein n=1 Tax=Thanatephorus cucumeris (strain AG1-IA) TaxID=983506 RepID=L8X2E4_THACA|nr:hypothetical protein AG1IA_01578 [Rhizoctonia solani AG-1 IA]
MTRHGNELVSTQNQVATIVDKELPFCHDCYQFPVLGTYSGPKYTHFNVWFDAHQIQLPGNQVGSPISLSPSTYTYQITAI